MMLRAMYSMIRERPQDVKQLEGGALWVPNNENFLKNLEPRKLKVIIPASAYSSSLRLFSIFIQMDTLRKYMGDLGYQKKRAKKASF